MTTRTWIGGGNNKADNPDDWSPFGVPQPGVDSILMTQGTIKVRGSEIAGSNGLGGPIMDVQGDVRVNLSDDASVMPIEVVSGETQLHIHDEAMLGLTLGISGQAPSATVDLAANSRWIGNFSAFSGSLVINGAHGALFITNDIPSGATVVNPLTLPVQPDFVAINANIGDGSASITADSGATVEVGGSAASGQVFQANASSDTFGSVLSAPGILKIDHPNLFDGQLQLGIGEIDLVGLARADSYSYQQDLLSIYSCGKIIEKLSRQQVPGLQGSSFGSLAVEKTAVGVSIYTSNNASHPAGTLLPLYTSS
jgi:hypothetical protein